MATFKNEIKTISLFKLKSLSAGDSGTSDIVDVRDISSRGEFSINAHVAAGTSTTAGTTTFKYMAASTEDGSFVVPTSGTFGTVGPTIADYMISLDPILTPFIKIIATQTGSGTAGANSKISAELNVQ